MTGRTSIQLPLGFEGWSPLAQGVTLALMTFVQEDFPTISSALLASAGRMAWQTGFAGCFLGIWVGDILLYAIARIAGRPLLERKWASRYFNPVKVRESELWFASKGTWLLLSSRFVPGTRLPTYLAAGFLRLPARTFLSVTAIAVAIWTVGIFSLAHLFGAKLFGWLERWAHGGWLLLPFILLMIVCVRFAGSFFQENFWERLHGAIGRWTRWEFWPPWLFYAPVAIHYVWLGLRHRSFTLPTSSNPGIFSGGMVGESKMQTLEALTKNAPEFTAAAFLIESGDIPERVKRLEMLREQNGIAFPFILKPDMGQRGLGVKLIRAPGQIPSFFESTPGPVVLQQYAPGPHEVGVFYYRFPDQPRGRIFAITEKIFPYLTGDGQKNIGQLIWQDSRARFMAGKYLARLGEKRMLVPKSGERIKLVEAGNHAQGCIFKDGMHLNTPALEAQIDFISKKVDGFFFGRYDIRYASASDLREGKNFQIIELNGASSEATSIYDERNTLWSAHRTLREQWNLVFAIGAANRARGFAPMKLIPLLKLWRSAHSEMSKLTISD